MIPTNIKSIMQKLLNSGFSVEIIGGANRDYFLDIVPHDYDLFTSATGEEILKIFPQGKILGGEERQKKILTVIVDGVEVSQYRSNGDRTEVGKDLKTHLSFCDFRLNSIAMDIDGNIIDPFMGHSDITNEIIQCVGNTEDRINEDKLRALRAIRFSLKYGFAIESTLTNKIRYTDITDLPVERLREEILKILMFPGALATLESYNILTKIIPEFKPNIHLKGGSKHGEFVDEHMYNAQDEACKLTNNPVLIFGVGLHDIGKYYTKEGEGETTSFHNHEKVGADMIKKIMLRLKFSTQDIKFVSTLISEHMFGPWKDDTITTRGFIRHFNILDEAGISIEEYMIMLYCDNQGNLANTRKKFGDFIKNNELHKKYYELKHSSTPFSVKDLNIGGQELIDMGMKPGKEIGVLLDDVYEKVMDGLLENNRPVLMVYCRTKVNKIES